MDQALINMLLNSNNLYIVSEFISRHIKHIATISKDKENEEFKDLDKDYISFIQIYNDYTLERIESEKDYIAAVYEDLCRINNYLLDVLQSEYRLNGLTPSISTTLDKNEKLEIFNIYVEEILIEEEIKLDIQDTEDFTNHMIFGIFISVILIIYSIVNDLKVDDVEEKSGAVMVST